MNALTLPVSTNPSFVEGTNFQFAWDSTSLGLLKECPRKYYYNMVCGYHGKNTSVHLEFGILYHKSLERYDHYRFSGMSHDEATDKVIRLLLIESIDLPLSEDGKKTRQTLVRSVIWYLEHYKDDEIKTMVLANGKPAVELSFKLESGITHNGVDLLYCGHLDRVVEFMSDHYVMDRKTTGGSLGSYYFTQYNPDNQMSGYSLASKVIFEMPVKGVMIDAAQVMVGFTAFGRSITTRTDAQLEEWLGDFEDWTGLALRYAERGQWPMNDKSCHKYGGCPFRDICSHDPRVRDTFLKTKFETRIWNPLEER
jgi:PD-(D/E)XK nuclease superfamily